MKLSKVGGNGEIYASLESLIELHKKKGVSREIIKQVLIFLTAKKIFVLLMIKIISKTTNS